MSFSQSQSPRGLRHKRSSPARTLGSWVRIALKTWMFVFILCLCSVAVLRRQILRPRSSTDCLRLRNWSETRRFTSKWGQKKKKKKRRGRRIRTRIRIRILAGSNVLPIGGSAISCPFVICMKSAYGRTRLLEMCISYFLNIDHYIGMRVHKRSGTLSVK
jgi:hypothetical protein